MVFELLSAAALTAATPAASLPQSSVAKAPEDLAAEANADTVEAPADRFSRMTVPVTIEGEGPFRFMIDTGSQSTVVTRSLSKKLGLPVVGNAIVVGMASQVPVELVALDGLEFAARTFDGLEVPLLEKRHVGADGILGLDSLQDLRVLIDFRDGSIAVNDAKQLGGNRGYEIVVRARHRLGRLIITRADIDGVNTAVIIDTGAQNSIGNMALRDRLRAKHRETIRTTDVNGFDIFGELDFARNLRIKDIQLSNLPILFSDGPAFEQLGLHKKPAMILGMRDLRVFDRIAIDFAQRKVLFDVPSGVGYRRRMDFGGFASRIDPDRPLAN